VPTTGQEAFFLLFFIFINKHTTMPYFISLDVTGTQIEVFQDVYPENADAARDITGTGHLIAFVDNAPEGARASCYGATDNDNLLELCQNHFNFDVTTYDEAVTWFKENVGPVFKDGEPI